MRVAVVGTRGIPGVHGGVERHCEELYPRLAALGVEVTVYARAAYVPESGEYRGVEVVSLPAPEGRGVEALFHTARAVAHASRRSFDVMHVHSVGPGTMVPLARVLGQRHIVFTFHAPDYLQRKWGPMGRAVLRTGERLGTRWSARTIAVSAWGAADLQRRLGVRAEVIPNGPGLTEVRGTSEMRILRDLGLQSGGYVLFVGRLVPDKRVEDLVAAVGRLAGKPPLVVVGDSDDDYRDRLAASAPEGTLFPGWVGGDDLVDLYRGAAVFVLPSAVEGAPIAPLEAMQFGVPVVLSEIAANMELLGSPPCGAAYTVGDVAALADALGVALCDGAVRDRWVAAARERVAANYDWDVIAGRTLAVYEEVLSGPGRG